MMSPSAWSTNQVPPALRDVRAWSSGAQAGLADQISFHTPFDRCGLMPVRATVTNNAIFRYDLHNGERSAFPHNAGPPRGPIGDVVGNRQVGCNNVANDHSLLPSSDRSGRLRSARVDLVTKVRRNAPNAIWAISGIATVISVRRVAKTLTVGVTPVWIIE